MELHFYTPENEILKQYLEGYYFFNNQDIGAVKSYKTFPNNYGIVTVNLNADVSLDIDKISIGPSNDQSISASFAYRYKNPITVQYTGPFREITIYFKPLGINHFVDHLETLFAQKRMTAFTPQFPDFKKEMENIFYIGDRSLQIKALEDYWLSKLMAKDLTLMKRILEDIESNLKIEDIAKKHHISRKHLNHLVQKHLGKSLMEYRKIFRFRKVIHQHQDAKNLTELTYENSFFDQSHLIKDFKSLTAINPHLFFKQVNTAHKNVWLLT